MYKVVYFFSGHSVVCLFVSFFLLKITLSAFHRLSTLGRWAFSMAGPTPTVWNSLPDSLRDPASAVIVSDNC